MYEDNLQDITNGIETLWINANIEKVEPYFELNGKKFVHVKAAQNRLLRFMPYIEKAFPQTSDRKGLIESELIEIDKMKKCLSDMNVAIKGRLFLKDDAHLPIAGSVKARGGIYEVLKFSEELAIKKGLMKPTDNHIIMDSPKFRELFGKYTIQVGSTGNLGLSIGIISAKMGYKAIVHMSSDAKEWKKQMLRDVGVKIREYEGDYADAVKEGRKLSAEDEYSYFVDDESSQDLFFGYSTAALRLKVQLRKKGVVVDENHPLFVYIPCGVGGAPGGITFGLKQMFGSNVHCFFVEPVNAPCFALSMITGKGNDISVYDAGLSGKTEADGLAVSSASGFVCEMMKPLISGCITATDESMEMHRRLLYEKEKIYVEVSAAAGFCGMAGVIGSKKGKSYIESIFDGNADDITHVVWATGGGLQEMTNKVN